MTKLVNDKNYNCTVFYDNGEQSNVFSTALNTNQLDDFNGWQCEAGFSRIYVHSDGTVWSSECNNDYLGSLNDGSFDLLKHSTVCTQTRCVTSADELMLRKFKN
jgi:hypothetical protein